MSASAWRSRAVDGKNIICNEAWGFKFYDGKVKIYSLDNVDVDNYKITTWNFEFQSFKLILIMLLGQN